MKFRKDKDERQESPGAEEGVQGEVPHPPYPSRKGRTSAREAVEREKEVSRNILNIIEIIKGKGFKVYIHHERPVIDYHAESGLMEDYKGEPILYSRYVAKHQGLTRRFAPNGGKTECWIELPGQWSIRGEAVCSPRDRFSRRTGRNIAISRALTVFFPLANAISDAKETGKLRVGDAFIDIGKRES